MTRGDSIVYISVLLAVGAECEFNTTVYNLNLKPGWWRYSRESDELLECANHTERGSPCIGGVEAPCALILPPLAPSQHAFCPIL